MAYPNVLNISFENDPDLDGTSPLEVFSLTFFVPICSFILWFSANTFQLSRKTFELLELCLLNLSLLLALTIFSENLVLYTIALILIALVVLLMKLPSRFSFSKAGASVPAEDLNRRFVGGYRGHLLLATCTSILAVDFGAFPSRFAKTESFGWSVMDAGVGSFVLLHGLTSAHGRGAERKGLKKGFTSSLPLLALGFIRLAAISATGYHKVVPEYGIHWNFFFTLAFTKMVCSSVLETTKLSSGLLALVSMLCHQALLTGGGGLAELVLSEWRRNFLEANKEGVCSLLGFVSLYFCGVQMGKSLLWKKGSRVQDYLSLLLRLVCVGAGGWLLMLLLHSWVQPVSRRMANVPYCIWVVALTSLQLSLHLLQELGFLVLGKSLGLQQPPESLLWRAVNHDGLAYFLLANLLTGLVNVSLDTGRASDPLAVFIMVIYLAILTGFSVVCYRRSFRLKFW